MKPVFRSLLPVFLAVACCGALSARAAGEAENRFRGLAQSFGSGYDKTDVMADSADYDLESGWTTFIGNVAIRHGGWELRADRIRYKSETGDAQAFGNVSLSGEDGTLVTGDTLDVNLNERAARVETVDLYVKPFRAIADEATVTGASKAGGSYEIEGVTLTTCTNEPGSFHWSVHASRARLRPDDDVTGWGVVPRLFGIPFFYVPYYWKDLERHYGFRFQPGWRGSWGAFLLASYKLPLLRDKEAREFVDNYVFVDYRSKRGFAFGDRVQWSFGDDESKGYLTGWYQPEDREPPEKVVLDKDDPRYRVRFKHDWNATDRDQVLLHALYVSDVRVQKDFFRKDYREMTEPDNYASYTHYGDAWSGGLTARARLNDFYGQTERLPEAWFDLAAFDLADTGVYLENETAAAFLRRRFAEPGDGAWAGTSEPPEEYEAFRFDTRFELSYPGKYFGWLSFVPRASWRGTYYDKTRKEIAEKVLSTTVTTNAAGKVATTTAEKETTRWDEDDAGFRSVFEIGAEVSTRAYGFWDAEDGAAWRHVVEPYANYTYVPEPNLVPGELYQFDGVDALDKKHSLRVGVRQRWQTKDPVADSASEPWYLDVWGDIDLDPAEDDGEHFLGAGWDARWRPASWMRVRWEGFYDNGEGELDTTEVQLTAWHDVFRCDALYRYRRDENSCFDGGVSWYANERWAFNLFARYEFETSQVEEVGGWIQRSWDCLALRLIASVEPGYEDEAGRDEDDDWHVTITGWLTDFVPASILEEDVR